MFLSSHDPVIRVTILMFAGLFLGTQAAEARMYQWINPETGNTQLSGTPPTWYRGSANGPRVFVYDNGQLIDDTAVSVSDLHRSSLRNNAFSLAKEEDLAASERRAKLKAALQRSLQEEEKPVVEEVKEEPSSLTDLLARVVDRKTEKEEKQTEEPTQADTLEQLKSLIDAWDQQQSDQARKVLEALQ